MDTVIDAIWDMSVSEACQYLESEIHIINEKGNFSLRRFHAGFSE